MSEPTFLPSSDGIVPVVDYRLPPNDAANTDDDQNPENWEEE